MRELVEITATLHAVEDAKFSCAACQVQYNGRQDAAEMNQKLRVAKACWGGAPRPVHVLQDAGGRVYRFTTCPGNFVSNAVIHWIDMHAAFSRGLLPFPGSISDQPAKALDVFRVIESHKNARALEAAQKAEQARRNRGARG